MSTMIPPNRPKISRAEALARIPVPVDLAAVTVAAFRGYYSNGNERGIYDDCIVVLGPEHFSTYNANVDPSAFRSGIANLIPGVWRYKPGTHGLSKPKVRQYQAYVQAGPVTVHRDGKGNDTGWFGINIHKGSNGGTSSLGCQTIPPAQWDAFKATLNDQLKRNSQRDFSYILV